jgi:hypothetical protein
LKILLIGNVNIENYLHLNQHKVGGIIFNITKNLSTLLPKGLIKIVYPLSKDNYAEEIRKEIERLGVGSLDIEIEKTPISNLTETNKEELRYNLEQSFNIQKLSLHENDIKGFDIIVSDLSLIEPLKYLIKNNPQAKVFIDATSKEDVYKLDSLINDNMVVKFNRELASHYTLKTLFDAYDCFEIKDALIRKRINQALITLDKDGCFFYHKNHQGIIRAEVITDKKYYHAGSAFFAGVINAFTLSPDIEFMAKQGIEKSSKQISAEIETNFLKSLNSDK